MVFHNIDCFLCHYENSEENETSMMPRWLEIFVLDRECMVIIDEFHAQPTEISDVARLSRATETLHRLKILQNPTVLRVLSPYIQKHIFMDKNENMNFLLSFVVICCFSLYFSDVVYS